jgi:hypothetical protein
LENTGTEASELEMEPPSHTVGRKAAGVKREFDAVVYYQVGL